ncbi:hypothetical protein KRR39_05705 [Nocardioides panacis]|uniref:Uncharacterized protein n=1 Tax=Nocardioides panacis TaxID=2849501 RepID=A0A975T0C3_9ACTN|nr:hypothetical protein [Nocardioides panacis]QWZ09280.1 hypothetical protein KRR39_05705 [Nocardioides panacis]
MTLDTEIPGSPGSIESAAHWLSGTLAPSVSKASDALNSARGDAQSDWDGEAGSAFASTMRGASAKADDLHGAATDVARSLDSYAGSLRGAQDKMADIRDAASAAGLTVHGKVIENPGPGPTRPGPMALTTDTPPSAIDAHDAAVKAYEAHQELVRAWNKAVAAAEAVWTDLKAGADRLSDKYRGLSGPQWVLTAADIAGGLSGAALEYNASALKQTSATFKAQAVRDLDRALKTDPGAIGKTRWYQDLDHARGMSTSADDLARTASTVERSSKTMPLKLGGALAAAGILWDIHSGKDPTEAVVSGAGGFLASIGAGAATGAIIGSFVPIPGVGTAAGAIIGAGVGIFTSGAIDSLFENGPDVGQAAAAGWDAVEDTGGAIVDGVGAVGGAIGGLFD